ncbi:MAG: 1,4-alpha-glucan branching protein GlgB [Gemmatimonadota bacterium]
MPPRKTPASSRAAKAPPTAVTSLLSEQDIYLFNEGTHLRLYDHLGAHLSTMNGEKGTYFAVWAPAAKSVSVIGQFNEWNPSRHPLIAREESGIWEGFVPGVEKGDVYKYHIVSNRPGYEVDKADPLAFATEHPPQTGSIIWPLGHRWEDDEWMASRQPHNSIKAPISIYEVHLGSWRRDDQGNSLSYRAVAEPLAAYVKANGFTHVQLLPIMEHPFFGSWGYQTTSYFAPTSRFGEPQDLMFLIDHLHRSGIGVILDWVPSHFPTDEHSLGYFDGQHLYEHADPRQGFHPDWQTLIFNYGRPEVRSFLLSSALFWLDRYHADGLRVDAVASMLYLDYSRQPGEWIPNKYGGRENLEAIDFLKKLNEVVHQEFPDVLTIAEESTSWPMVSRPTYIGGLGFDLKWDMGWMHDTLKYMALDPIHRRHHHNELTFRGMYAFSENFVLPLSHDEVVHLKGSLLGKMPGDPWRKFANLRLLFGNMFSQPGKKLLFMGGEIGVLAEWNHDGTIDWDLLEDPLHRGVQHWVADLNALYAREPALHLLDCEPGGFAWIDCNDDEQSVLTLLRRAGPEDPALLFAMNFTPVPRPAYRIGVPFHGRWLEVLNSDAPEYGGSGVGNLGGVEAEPVAHHGYPQSISVTLPPLATLVFRGVPEKMAEKDVLPVAGKEPPALPRSEPPVRIRKGKPKKTSGNAGGPTP